MKAFFTCTHSIEANRVGDAKMKVDESTVPSSLQFQKSTYTTTDAAAAAASSSLNAHTSLTSNALIPAIDSGTTPTRRRKRERESLSASDLYSSSSSSSASTLIGHSCSPPRLHSKLATRTLVYQLHILHADEKLKLSTARTLECVRTHAHATYGAEEEEDQQAEEDIRAHGEDAINESSTKREVGGVGKLILEGTSCVDGSSSSSGSTSCFESSSDQSDSTTTSSSSASQPLFPDSTDYVRLFLSSEAAHSAFLELAAYWHRRGIRGVKERIIELQVIQPINLLVIGGEEQSEERSSIEEEESSMDDTPIPNTINIIRASPFEKPPTRTQMSIPPSSSSSSAPSSSVLDHAAASTPHSSLPLLTPPALVSASVRSLLSREEGFLDGYCVSNDTSTPLESSSSSTPSSLLLTPSNVVRGEVILRGSICAERLHLIDDEKKSHVHQQLLTDLFGRMDLSQKNKQ